MDVENDLILDLEEEFQSKGLEISNISRYRPY